MPVVLSKPPPPDLCLLAVFRQMSLNDRLKAHDVCPRWGRLVREACRRDVRSLTIILSDGGSNGGGVPSLKEMAEHINKNYTSSSDNQLFSSCSTRMSQNCGNFQEILNKGNCLQITFQMWNLATLKKIIFIFFTLTELTFLNRCNKGSKFKIYKNLMKLLKMSLEEERLPLTAFRLIDRENTASRDKRLLFCLLNSGKLKYLTILNDEHQRSTDENNRNRARLFGHVSKFFSSCGTSVFVSKIFDSIYYTEAINITIQLDLLNRKQDQLKILGFTYIPHTVNLVVQLTSEHFFHFRYTEYRHVCVMPPIMLNLHKSVTSISLNLPPTACSSFFFWIGTAALPQLTHFGVKIDFSLIAPARLEHRQLVPRRPIEKEVFLELQLTITAHMQIHWLNLPQFFPALQTIRLVSLECKSCDVKTVCFAEADYLTPTKRIQASECLREVIFFLHLTGVPLDQILFEGEEHLGSSKQLLQL